MALYAAQHTPSLAAIVIHLHETPELAADADRQEWVMAVLATILHTTDQPAVLAWTVQALEAHASHSYQITPIASISVSLAQAWLVLQPLCHYKQIAAIDLQIVTHSVC